MKQFIKFCTSLTALVVAVVMSCVLSIQISIPDNYIVTEGNTFSLKSKEYLSIRTEEALPTSSNENQFNADIKFLGCIGVKTVNVKVAPKSSLLVCGTPFGIKMLTEGVIVTKISDIDSGKDVKSPAREAGLKEGDVILSINGISNLDNNTVSDIISNCSGNKLDLTVSRDGETLNLKVTPTKTRSGDYLIGAWVRDSCAGIGTLTFYDPENSTFGGLGHPVCDVDTGEIMPLDSGEIVNVKIVGVVKGTVGTPGELMGAFLPGEKIGTIKTNSEQGVFGEMSAPEKFECMQPASRQEIKTGGAKILTTVDGVTPQYFDIVIEKVNMSNKNRTKNMTIKITDPELLKITGGIVPGMSGSPIIQNGKLIGAVTHVFVNDPTRGYGIFIDNMLQTSQNSK